MAGFLFLLRRVDVDIPHRPRPQRPARSTVAGTLRVPSVEAEQGMGTAHGVWRATFHPAHGFGPASQRGPQLLDAALRDKRQKTKRAGLLPVCDGGCCLCRRRRAICNCRGRRRSKTAKDGRGHEPGLYSSAGVARGRCGRRDGPGGPPRPRTDGTPRCCAKRKSSAGSPRCITAGRPSPAAATGNCCSRYSGGREGHVCPFGRVELMQSDDDGRTWSEPRVLADSPIDDRDSGVLETAKGTILVTTFHLAWPTSRSWPRPRSQSRAKPGAWPAERLSAGRPPTTARRRSGARRSWACGCSAPPTAAAPGRRRYDCLVNSPHGPIQLADGRLLYAGKDLGGRRARRRVRVDRRRRRPGAGWPQLPARPGDARQNTTSCTPWRPPTAGCSCRSATTTRPTPAKRCKANRPTAARPGPCPHAIGVWGLPSHLLRLNDGRLLMTYGHRRQPFGNQARMSDDGGRTWSEPMIVSGDGTGGDLGYPSTVQLADGSLLTVWYELMAGSPRRRAPPGAVELVGRGWPILAAREKSLYNCQTGGTSLSGAKGVEFGWHWRVASAGTSTGDTPVPPGRGGT